MAASRTDCEMAVSELSKQDGKWIDEAEAGGISAVEEVEDDDDGSFMCPVCSDGFVVPKLLPCGHVVCQLCMLHWLNAKKATATCPFCRLRILVSDEAYDDDEIDVYEEVCTLPTDFFTEAVAETHKLLQEPHICRSCDAVPAVSYCMQCCKKLCRKCGRRHKQIPATRKHPRVNLSCLTAEKLVGTRPVMCETHPDRLAMVYCPEHEEVICRKCGSTSHKRCVDKNMVEDLERGAKVELQRQVERLKRKTTELAKKVKDVRFFKANRSMILDMFRTLRHKLDKQIEKFESIPEVNDKLFMSSLSSLERAQTILIQNDTTTSNLVQSASGVALLKTLEPLKTHLDHLERKAEKRVAILPEISFGEEELNHLKEAAAVLEPTEVDDSRAEAWIRLTVENISRLDGKVYSPTYMIRNQPWKIFVKKREFPVVDEAFFGMCLTCNAEPELESWFYIAQTDFYIRDSRLGRVQRFVGPGHRFWEGSRNGGIENMLWKSIMNHVANDRITVEAHVKVHPLNVQVPYVEWTAITWIPDNEYNEISGRTPYHGSMTAETPSSSDNESDMDEEDVDVQDFNEDEELASESESEETDRESEFDEVAES